MDRADKIILFWIVIAFGLFVACNQNSGLNELQIKNIETMLKQNNEMINGLNQNLTEFKLGIKRGCKCGP